MKWSTKRWAWGVCVAALAGGPAAAQFPPEELPPLPVSAPISPLDTVKLATRPVGPRADDKKADAPKDGGGGKDEAKGWVAWQPPGRAMSLGECLAVGGERQPAIRAAVASLAAAERGYLSLCNLGVLAEFVAPDLPVRRRQSERGLAAAGAKVMKARQENAYDISRLYYTYVYATQQEQTAADIVAQLDEFSKLLQELLKLPPDPKNKINEFTVTSFDAVIADVRLRRAEASGGRKRALYALMEAMGVRDEFEFVPADKELPLMGGAVDRATVVRAAFARRPELVQSRVLSDVTRLEVEAQCKLSRQRRAHTFAGGTDLHSEVLPLPLRNGDYRPGAVPPEMPPEVVGRVGDRVARVECFVVYHDEALRKAENLVWLDASNAYENWEEAVEGVRVAKAAHERAQRQVDKARAAAATRMEPELLIQTESLASKAQAEYVKAVYRQVLALIALEKVTGGGVVPAFPGR